MPMDTPTLVCATVGATAHAASARAMRFLFMVLPDFLCVYGIVNVRDGTTWDTSMGCALSMPFELAMMEYFAAEALSAVKTKGVVAVAEKAVLTLAPCGKENPNVPVSAATGPQATSMVGPPVSICTARVVALAGTTVPRS